MEITGIKFVCEHSNGDISTWHDNFEEKVEDIIKKIRHRKFWMGGKFLEIRLDLNVNGEYHEVFLDVKNQGYNQLLGR